MKIDKNKLGLVLSLIAPFLLFVSAIGSPHAILVLELGYLFVICTIAPLFVENILENKVKPKHKPIKLPEKEIPFNPSRR